MIDINYSQQALFAQIGAQLELLLLHADSLGDDVLALHLSAALDRVQRRLPYASSDDRDSTSRAGRRIL